MPCRACKSANQRAFPAEINLHFPGMQAIDTPTVWIFPEVCVCLDCGFAELMVPDAEVKTLHSRDWRGRADRASAQ